MITGGLRNEQKRSADDLSPCNLAIVIYTGGVLSHTVPTISGDGVEFVDFVLDLASVICDDLVTIDYDHDTKEVIGFCENVRAENGQLMGNGSLLPFSRGDRASEVAYKTQFVPYGVSPTIDLNVADREDIETGQEIEINGRRLAGPLTIYRNVPVLGVSICPYPTDGNTSIQTLKRNLNRETENEPGNKTEKETEEKMEEEIKTPQAAEATSVKDAELQKYIDKFGLEAGVRFYQEGKSFEDAISERFDELNAQVKKMSETCDPEEKKTELADETEPPKEEEKDKTESTALKKEMRTLRQSLTELSQNVHKMSVLFTKLSGESSPVSGGSYGKSPSYSDSFAKFFNKN